MTTTFIVCQQRHNDKENACSHSQALYYSSLNKEKHFSFDLSFYLNRTATLNTMNIEHVAQNHTNGVVRFDSFSVRSHLTENRHDWSEKRKTTFVWLLFVVILVGLNQIINVSNWERRMRPYDSVKWEMHDLRMRCDFDEMGIRCETANETKTHTSFDYHFYALSVYLYYISSVFEPLKCLDIFMHLSSSMNTIRDSTALLYNIAAVIILAYFIFFFFIFNVLL